MKKILSFVLVLAMIASMMCISVSAANVVGTHGKHSGEENSVTDGVEKPAAGSKFTHQNDTAEIKANIYGTTHDKYAVDLEYTPVTIQVVSNATWNVNTLMYEGTTKVFLGNKNVESDSADYTFDSTVADNGTNKIVKNVGSFALTNYSNAAITISAEVAPYTANDAEGDPVEMISVSIKNNVGDKEIVDEKDTIAGVTPLQGQTAAAVTAAYTASMHCSDWAAAFAMVNSNGQMVIATITFTIAPAN